MTKTKRQLRAEAVERLTKLNEHGYWEFPVHVALCGRDVPDVDEERAIIADLLTDDCGPCYSCAKLAELVAENSALHVKLDELERADVSQAVEDTAERVTKTGEMYDSREKLEADTRVLLGWVADSAVAWCDADAAVRYFIADAIRMLDSQTAITERHILTHPDERDEQIAELQREVDRLTRENISLARDLGECMAERDELIAEIDALEYQGELDEPRGTKVDINGEVSG